MVDQDAAERYIGASKEFIHKEMYVRRESHPIPFP